MIIKKEILNLTLILVLCVTIGCEKKEVEKLKTNTPIAVKQSAESSSVLANSDIFNKDNKPFFNSINELDTLNVKKENILQILEKNNIYEKDFYNTSTFKFFGRTDETIWLSKTAQIRMTFANNEDKNPLQIYMVGFFFGDVDSWKKNRKIIEDVLLKTIPYIMDPNKVIDDLETAVKNSPTEEVDKEFGGISVRLVSTNNQTFTLAVIKRKLN